MKLSKVNQLLLTMLYGVSLIFLTLMIFEGSRFDIIDDIVTYVFYGCSVLAILKALSDLIIHKTVKDLIYCVMVAMPLGIFLIYLVLSLQTLSYTMGGIYAPYL